MISIIVPVYNVEKYLKRCVDSVLNQTYSDFELILVDDGSVDNCPKLCDEVANSDSRIFVIHKKNGGLSSARNTGLDIVKGEYIFFLDSDDWLKDTTVLENFYNSAIEYKSTFVFGLFGFATEQKFCPIRVNKRYKRDDLFFFSNPYMFSACNKLYKKDLFDDTRFQIGRVNEDVDIIPLLFSKAVNPVCLNKYTYCYFTNENSLTRSEFSDNRFDMFKSVAHVYDEFDGTRVQKNILYQNLFGFQIFSVYLSILKSKNKKENMKKFFQKLEQSNFKNYFFHCFICFIKNESFFKSIKKICALILLFFSYCTVKQHSRGLYK